MSAYDLLDIDMLKEMDPDSVVEVELPGKRGSVTRRRSITTFHEDIEDDNDDKKETRDDNNDATSSRVAKTANKNKNNNNGFNDSFGFLSWDMSPSKLHEATKGSKIDSELLEQKMQNFLLGEEATTTTTTTTTTTNRRASM